MDRQVLGTYCLYNSDYNFLPQRDCLYVCVYIFFRRWKWTAHKRDSQTGFERTCRGRRYERIHQTDIERAHAWDGRKTDTGTVVKQKK